MSLDINITMWCDGETPKSPNVYGTCTESIDYIYEPAVREGQLYSQLSYGTPMSKPNLKDSRNASATKFVQ